MTGRITLGDIFAAYWDDISGASRQRHVALWLCNWGAAIAARYVTCEYCGLVHDGASWARLRKVAGDRIPPYVDTATNAVYRTEVRHCTCGASLIYMGRIC